MTDTTTALTETQQVRRGHWFYPAAGDALPELYAT